MYYVFEWLKNFTTYRRKKFNKNNLRQHKIFLSNELLKLLRVLDIIKINKRQAICYIILFKTNLIKTKNKLYNTEKKLSEYHSLIIKKTSNTYKQVDLKS